MRKLIISSSFDFYDIDENNKKIGKRISNSNKFLDNLKKILSKRDCCLVVSGNPRKIRDYEPLSAIKRGFELSDIAFKEYIYLDDTNKEHVKEYVKRANLIDLCGGHLPTCNQFINEIGLRELLKDYKGVIIGASGGGMNMANIVYCMPEAKGEYLDKDFNRYLNGLNLTNVNIIPHFNLIKDKQLDGVRILQDILIPDSYKCKMILLNDGSYIIEEKAKQLLFGKAYLLENGKIIKICEDNECIELN